MNFTYATPETVGISTENILKYIDALETQNLSTHNVIIARGDKIICEKYWEPFDANFQHRQYSVSKSIVALAVGFAEQEGLLSLDDPMTKYFADELKNQTDENLKNQTIRNMLNMQTAKGPRAGLSPETEDHVRFYFEHDGEKSRPGGTIFEYDSDASFVLGALVERLTGKPFMEHLREKMFDKIGVSKDAYCLKAAGGHSWGDSAMMCTPKDLLLMARFCLNYGKWNGEQILNEKFAKDAVSKLVSTNTINYPSYESFGYGYFFWRTYDNSFLMNGMGCQLAVCVPDKDLILIYNGDNQGIFDQKEAVIKPFFELVSRTAQDAPLPENSAAHKMLNDKVLKLMVAKGETKSDFQEKINGKEFLLKENPMGITKFSLHFGENKCTFRYTNAQGEKELYFGMGENVFGVFPQEGYSDDVTMKATKNFYYKCACSAVWDEPQKLYIKVQVIDKYFGRLHINFGFADENTVGISMSKVAEFFMDEYRGIATGYCK